MRHFTKYILFASILFFRITTIDAYACSCAGIRPPCEAYWEASAVFVGVMTGDSSISVKDGQYQSPVIKFADRLAAAEFDRLRDRIAGYRFQYLNSTCGTDVTQSKTIKRIEEERNLAKWTNKLNYLPSPTNTNPAQ